MPKTEDYVLVDGHDEIACHTTDRTQCSCLVLGGCHSAFNLPRCPPDKVYALRKAGPTPRLLHDLLADIQAVTLEPCTCPESCRSHRAEQEGGFIAARIKELAEEFGIPLEADDEKDT